VLEHALIMLLLLVGLLSIHREQWRYVPWVVLAGVACLWVQGLGWFWGTLGCG
jgi:hypothetical protein